MATQQHIKAYRAVLREVNRASVNPRATRPKTVTENIRALFAEHREGKEAERFYADMRNTATFIQSQRMHKTLLERYNPLHDMSTEERVEATARRVGLNMPINSEDKE